MNLSLEQNIILQSLNTKAPRLPITCYLCIAVLALINISH